MLSPLAPNTQRHPSPDPLHLWSRHPPTPKPFHLRPTILAHTHPLNPFTHGPKDFLTLIPQIPFTHGLDIDTHSNRFHPWTPILTDTYPLNHFIPGLRHSLTWSPQLCAGAWGRSRGKGGIMDGVGTRVLGCGPRLRVWTKGKHGGQGRCRNLGKKQGPKMGPGY